MKNILILAAENSAETYGVQVVNRFRAKRKDIHFFGVGGAKLAENGVEILIQNREFAVIGIVEVLSSILKFRKFLNHLLKKALEKRAEAALLIDFPDFNLRLAKKLSKAGIRVYHYISPTVWAWRYSRVKTIRKYVHHLFIIFPFEIDIYKKEKIPFTYTGHPLLPLIKVDITKDQYRNKQAIKNRELVISILPGSRPSEVRFLLPEMIKALGRLKAMFPVRAFLLRAHSIDKSLTDALILGSGEQIQTVDQSQGHNLINASDLIITTCGTSNLEIALLGVPFVACYRVHPLSYRLGIHLVKIRRYSIVNILARDLVVPELIQRNFTAEKIVSESQLIINKREVRDKMQNKFREIKALLHQDRDPSEIISARMINDLFPSQKTS